MQQQLQVFKRVMTGGGCQTFLCVWAAKGPCLMGQITALSSQLTFWTRHSRWSWCQRRY